MKKRIKNKLTSKQAKRISLLVSVVCAILLAILCFTSFPSDVDAMQVFVLVFCCISLPIVLYLLFYMIILKGDLLEWKEKDAELQKLIKGFLCKEKFTELSFIPEIDNGSIEYELLLTIIKEMDCKFFAKLKENDEILLIVKNKEEKEIYSCEISNYSYFNARFKPKTN